MKNYRTRISQAFLALVLATSFAWAQDKPKEFTKPTIDIGIVVKDLDKSAKFYTEALGLTEVKGFAVTGEVGKKIGLINNMPATVRVFAMDGADNSARLKVMSFPEAPGKNADQSYIHSTVGIRYLTIFVTSTDKALERLKKAGVKTLGETPVSLGGKDRLTTLRDPDGNFIELIGP